MKNSIKYLLLSAAALAAVSCESWLDVTPPSEIRAEAHYSSAEASSRRSSAATSPWAKPTSTAKT